VKQILVLAFILFCLTGCACNTPPPDIEVALPRLTVPPPLAFRQPPDLQPSAYVIRQPVQVQYQYVPVPVAAPMQAAPPAAGCFPGAATPFVP
jgi:hypothetical protein